MTASDDNLNDWSKAAFTELKQLDQQKYQILNRCCRAALNGAVCTHEYIDPVLLNRPHRLKLRYCPECGAKLKEGEEE